MSIRRFASLVTTISALLACSNSDAERACLDTADAVAKAAERCGQDYQTNYDGFISAGAGGDCGNVVRVRDEDALREECWPSFETISCDELLRGNVDESCQDQLQRPAASAVTLQDESSVRSSGAELGRALAPR